jgi:hypothetical protein
MKNKFTNTKMNLAAILIIAAMLTYGNLFSQSQGVDSPAVVNIHNEACLACPGTLWQLLKMFNTAIIRFLQLS